MDNQHGAGIAPPRRGGEPVRPRCGVPAAKLAWRGLRRDRGKVFRWRVWPQLMAAFAKMRGGLRATQRHGAQLPDIAMMSVVALTVPLVLLELAISDSTVRLIPLMVMLPALTAAVGTLRETVHAVVWVVLVITAVLAYRPLPSLGDQVIVMPLALALGALCVLTCRSRIKREEETRRMRSGAAALQHQMLRALPVATDRVIVDRACLMAEEDLLVGGDIYEAVASPSGRRPLIGDVQGKGLPAVAAAFAVQGAFRETAQSEPTLTAVADALEAAVERHNAFAAQSGEPERFATALLLGVDDSAETQALNCGHLPPYLMTRASSPSHSRPNQACRSVWPNSPRNQGPSNGSLSRTARHSCSAATASPRHVTPPASSIPSKKDRGAGRMCPHGRWPTN